MTKRRTKKPAIKHEPCEIAATDFREIIQACHGNSEHWLWPSQVKAARNTLSQEYRDWKIGRDRVPPDVTAAYRQVCGELLKHQAAIARYQKRQYSLPL
jgi:hypothetical protein